MSKKITREEFLEKLLDQHESNHSVGYRKNPYLRTLYVDNCKKIAASIPEKLLEHPEIIYPIKCSLFPGSAWSDESIKSFEVKVDIKDGRVVITSGEFAVSSDRSETANGFWGPSHPARWVKQMVMEIQNDNLVIEDSSMTLVDCGKEASYFGKDDDYGVVYFKPRDDIDYLGYKRYRGELYYYRTVYDKDSREIVNNSYNFTESQPMTDLGTIICANNNCLGSIETQSLDRNMLRQINLFRPRYSNANIPTQSGKGNVNVVHESLDHFRSPDDPTKISSVFVYHTVGGNMFTSKGTFQNHSEHEEIIQVDDYALKAEANEKAVSYGVEYFVKKQNQEQAGRSR